MHNRPYFGVQKHYQQPPNYAGYPPIQQGNFQHQTPPPNYSGGETIIQINDNNDGTPCRYCATKTSNMPMRTVGRSTYVWCCILTPCLLCCLPFCMDGCKDVQLICVKCCNVKIIIEGKIY